MPKPMIPPSHFEDGTLFTMDDYFLRLNEMYERGYTDRKVENLPKMTVPELEDPDDAPIAMFIYPKFGLARAYLNGYIRAERGLSNKVGLWREAGESDEGPHLGLDDEE